MFDGEEYVHLTKTISGFSFVPLKDFVSYINSSVRIFSVKNRRTKYLLYCRVFLKEMYGITTSESTLSAAILETITVNINVTIPQFNNLRVRLNVTCVQTSQSTQLPIEFGYITSLKVVSAGRNLDAVLSESELLIPMLNGSYAYLDLGVVTNTGKSYYFILLKTFTRSNL